jgi:hypothetical protein
MNIQTDRNKDTDMNIQTDRNKDTKTQRHTRGAKTDPSHHAPGSSCCLDAASVIFASFDQICLWFFVCEISSVRDDFNCSATRGSTCTSRVAMGGEDENVRGGGREGGGRREERGGGGVESSEHG